MIHVDRTVVEAPTIPEQGEPGSATGLIGQSVGIGADVLGDLIWKPVIAALDAVFAEKCAFCERRIRQMGPLTQSSMGLARFAGTWTVPTDVYAWPFRPKRDAIGVDGEVSE
ncbi:MAG: hypothetical protein AAFQ43_12995, partial [Bacteroidota bacterium]